MGASFSDITLYSPGSYSSDGPQYREETSLKNFISDLYVQKMHGYKPPKVTRVCIQPAFYGVWDKPWKFGSIVSVACEFPVVRFESMDKQEKYHYLLDLYHNVMIQLCDEYHWDKSVFEKAYREVLESNFRFTIDYPAKQSRDRKRTAHIRLSKSETVTTLEIVVNVGGSSRTVKFFDKRNNYWYDVAYRLVRHAKWFDNDKFGIDYPRCSMLGYYAISIDELFLFEAGFRVISIDFTNDGWFQWE